MTQKSMDLKSNPPNLEATEGHLAPDPFTAVVGVLPAFKSVEEINAWLRNLRGHDETENTAAPGPPTE
jgi:hypothetical protein